MNTQLLLACALTVGAAAAASSPRYPVVPPDLSGTYVIDHSASDDPRKAVEKATSSLRRFKRNAVNSRLQDAMKTPDTLHITQRGDSVMLATSGRLHMTVVPGQPTSRTGQRGGTAETAGAWDGNALVVRTTAERFQRETRYALSGDGARIRVAVAMRAEQLSQPISYTLVYRRAPLSPSN